VKRLVIYSREWRDEEVLKLYRAFSVLLQRHRAYVIEKVLELSPKRALVFTYTCGWHGDVLFLAPYVTAVGPFETSDATGSPASDVPKSEKTRTTQPRCAQPTASTAETAQRDGAVFAKLPPAARAASSSTSASSQ